MTAEKFPPLLRGGVERALWKRVALWLGAIVCFILGIFGWLIPVVTGLPFYLLGLILMAMASRSVQRWINRTEAKLSPSWRRTIRATIRKIPIQGIRKRVRPPA